MFSTISVVGLEIKSDETEVEILVFSPECMTEL
jgi:hypothetical protein